MADGAGRLAYDPAMTATPSPFPLRATLIGASAVLMWATLALFTTLTGRIPPFQLAAMAFAVAFALALVFWRVRGVRMRDMVSTPLPVWALGVGGLFGYHFFYFMALRNAPPVEAGLIAYLWPLLIVLFSALLPGERLRWWHVAGAGTGLGGTAVLVLGGADGGNIFSIGGENAFGYGMAGLCALTWSAYSVLSRRFAHVPTDMIGMFCGVTAILALGAHLVFEQTVWPADTGQWLAVAALGLGPVGAAFFTWDVGMKKGDIRVLGALAYAAPLLSTILLIAFGKGTLTVTVGWGAILITGGAVLASRDMLVRKKA